MKYTPSTKSEWLSSAAVIEEEKSPSVKSREPAPEESRVLTATEAAAVSGGPIIQNRPM